MAKKEEYNRFVLADQYLRKKYGEDYEKLRIVIDYLTDAAREDAIDAATSNGYD